MIHNQNQANAMAQSFGKWKTWMNVPFVLLAVALLMAMCSYRDAHTPPYWVTLNSNTGYGDVWLYSTMNVFSATHITIPGDWRCTRLDNEVYTVKLDTPRSFYKLSCRQQEGFVRIEQVILP